MQYKVNKTGLGYYSVSPLPSTEELERHYKEKYYQNEHSIYSRSYTDDEIKYFENRAKITEYIFKKDSNNSKGRLFDAGAGEGFFAKYFYENGWDVVTCDFSKYGMEKHNPSLLPTLIQGEIFNILEKQIANKKSYDLINLDSLLEHVIDPAKLLRDLQKLLKKDSLLRIAVPNDYSVFQAMLLRRNLTHITWFAPPEHLHHFNFESIVKLSETLGYSIKIMMSSFPIELYLLNEHSNYAKNRSVGKQAHFSRVIADNFLFEQGIERYIAFYSACASANLGREAIVYVSKNT